jgi:hypothetical protein
MAVVELPYITGQPRSVSCASTMPLSTSALCVTSVPASVTGDEPPAIAMLRMLSGIHQRDDSMMTSVASRGSLSGLTGQTPLYRIGRSRRASSPPAISAAMRKIARHSRPESGPTPMGFVVFSSCISLLCTAAVAGGASLAPTAISWVSNSLR